MNAILIPSLLAVFPALQEGAPPTPPKPTVAVTAAPATESDELQSSEFGEPLYVNGKRVSDLEIKRVLAYGVGRVALESRKLKALTEQEWKLRESQGEDMTRYKVDEAALQVRYDKEIAEFMQRYPMLEVETEIARAYQSVELYKEQFRQTLEFDQMFFPGDPDEWPEVSKESIHAGSPQVDLIKDASENWDRRVAWAAESGEPMIEEDDMFMGLIRDYVIAALNTLVIVQTASDGLPEDLLMVVDGGEGFRTEIKTEEFFEHIRHVISESDIEDTKLFIALSMVSADKLKEAGVFMSDEEFAEYLQKLKSDLSESIFSFDFLALQGHQFPSTESYKDHMRLIESFKRMVADDLEPDPEGGLSPALTAHLPIANAIMGLARADAEVMLISAYDFHNNKWREDGWKWAEEKAWKLKGEIEAHKLKLEQDALARKAASERGENYEPEEEVAPFDRYWANLLDLHSDFWDPPMPATGKMPPMVGMKQKGRFGVSTRNDLERSIGESPYLQFLFGSSITDAIFFNMEPGSTDGPFLGPKGYYIIHLKTRTSPTNPLNLNDERHMELLKEDFVRRQFVKFAHDALANADVRGIKAK